MLQIVSFLVGLVEPPLVWPFSLLNGPLPHKEFNRKIAAVILKKKRGPNPAFSYFGHFGAENCHI